MIRLFTFLLVLYPQISFAEDEVVILYRERAPNFMEYTWGTYGLLADRIHRFMTDENIEIKWQQVSIENQLIELEKIKGNGLLNGIIFSSYISEIGNLIENIPLQVINDKSSFLRKITATAISAELYEKYNILTAINDSKFSDHLCVSPSLIISDENIEYFFKSLDEVLQKNINLKFLPVILNFLKSKFYEFKKKI